ncbi:MAG: radical SAM protein [Chloroflexi bacterium]|nr:MAG: radical SAM protein [Chloroflexota bacterium]
MRFYFDQTLSHQYSDIEECQRECRGDVGPLLPAMRDIFPPSPAEQQRIALMGLQHVPVLYRQMITEESWLLCNPTGPGYVIVMDAAALAFFDRFRTPCTLADLAAQARPTDQIVQATTLLFKAGLLTGTTPEQYWQEEDNSALTAWLHVTNSCNLRCSYCYIDKSQESMSQDTAYRAIDAVFRSANIHGFKRVQLKYAGGEASLRLAQVIAIHDYALQLAQQHAIALGACILSNGVYLSPRAMDDLKKRHIGITLSLDGIGTYQDRQRSFRHGFGSFQYVDRTIHKLLQHGMVPAISVTVSQRNIDGLPALMEYILDHALPFSFNYYRENQYAAHLQDLCFTEQHMIQGMKKVFKLLERRLPRYRILDSILDKAKLVPHQQTCGVGQNYLVIDQRGGIAKCQTTIEQTITTIHAHDPLQLINDDRTGVRNLSVEEKEGCQSCLWRHWCTGGCPTLTYQVTGRYDVKSPNCNIYQALFPAALHLEALRLLTYEPPFSIERLSTLQQEQQVLLI